ncbi:MAG: hypothetical protein RLZZ267_718 [Bacillota bacterium]|jgi:hypothetical protein
MRKWLSSSRSNPFPFEQNPDFVRTEVTDFLESHGFTIEASKTRIPIRMKVDNVSYESRIFIDYFVTKADFWYIVKVDRDRKPYEWTGSAIRDYILPYYMQFPDAEGVVVVNMRHKDLKVITFQF